MKVTSRLIQQTQLSDYISAIAWSPKNSGLAACSASGELILYQLNSSPFYFQQPGEMALNSLGFSADGQLLASAGQAGILKIWQVDQASSQPIFRQHHPSAWIDTLQWHPEKPLLAYAVGRDVYVVDLVNPEIYTQLPFQNSSVLSLAWHPQQNYLAVSGHGTVKIWNLSQPELAPQELPIPGASLILAWSQDGSYLASGNLDRTLSLLEWQNPPPWLMQGFPGKVRGLSWSITASSPLLAAACLDGISIWQRRSGSDQWQSSVLEHHQGFVRAIDFHPQKSLLASAGDDGVIFLWQDGKKAIKTIRRSSSGGFSCLNWDSSGDYLGAGTNTGEIMIWELLSVEQTTKKGFG